MACPTKSTSARTPRRVPPFWPTAAHCRATAAHCAVDQKFVLRGVKFEFDSERLTPEALNILNDVATTLQAYPNVDVELEGHTDSIGSDAYNQGLSERRANSVKTYLVGRGVDARRMTPVGYGEAMPIADNNTEEGRDENRRVELKVIED
jgi:OmpA-OmpF porin, OOP family